MTGVWCFIICFGATEAPSAPPVDSFCTNYERVVTTPEELALVLKLPRAMRDRMQGNELEYLCRCRGLKDVACTKAKQS